MRRREAGPPQGAARTPPRASRVRGGGRRARRIPGGRRARAAHAADLAAAAHRGDRAGRAADGRPTGRRVRLPPERAGRIAAVARQARRLSGLIDGMLDVSPLTGGHLSLELAEIDVAALMREVAQRFAPDAAAAACPLTLRLDHPLMGAARREPPGSDRHQPDRQRAQIRRRRPDRDIDGRATRR